MDVAAPVPPVKPTLAVAPCTTAGMLTAEKVVLNVVVGLASSVKVTLILLPS